MLSFRSCDSVYASCYIKPYLNCTFQSDLVPNGISFGVKSIEKRVIVIKISLDLTRFMNKILVYTQTFGGLSVDFYQRKILFIFVSLEKIYFHIKLDRIWNFLLLWNFILKPCILRMNRECICTYNLECNYSFPIASTRHKRILLWCQYACRNCILTS